MAYCTRCGAEAPNGAKFCGKCGNHIQDTNSDAAGPSATHTDPERYIKQPGGEEHSTSKPALSRGTATPPARKIDWPARWLLALWIAIACVLGIVRGRPVNAIWIAGVIGASIAPILIGFLLAAIVRFFNSSSRLVRDALCASAITFLLQLWGMHIEPSMPPGPIPPSASSSLQSGAVLDTTLGAIQNSDSPTESISRPQISDPVPTGESNPQSQGANLLPSNPPQVAIDASNAVSNNFARDAETVPMQKPSNTDGQVAWETYLLTIVAHRIPGGPDAHTFDYFVPAGDGVDSRSQRNTLIGSIKDTLADHGVSPGDVFVYGGPSSSQTRQVLVNALAYGGDGTLKGTTVVFIGDDQDKEMIQRAVARSGAKFYFYEMNE